MNKKNSKILLNKLKQIKPNHDMYKNINKLLKPSNCAIPALKSSNGSIISNGVDKANIIANEYDKIHKQKRNG